MNRNRQIWKFEQHVLSTGICWITMPKGAEILSVGIQQYSGVPAIWAMVDPEAPKVEHMIFIAWTGIDIAFEGLGRFIDTLQYSGLVWHIFDVGE